jgi:hypothetical protein
VPLTDVCCTSCQPAIVPARFVAAGPGPGRWRLEWFECGAHGPTDNIGGEVRENLTLLDRWRWCRGIGTERPTFRFSPCARWIGFAWAKEGVT